VGFGLWPLALVALVPLWWALESLRERGPGAAAGAGFAFGFAAHAGGYTWLWRLVDVFLGGDRLLGAALWLLHGAWFALGFALYGVLYRAVRRRGGPVALAGAAPLLVVEWLYPALFPVHLGDALVDRTLLVQSADLGGPLLLSAGVALANAAVFEGLRFARGERALPLGTWLLATLTALASAGYGALRIPQLERAIEAAPELQLGVVQANLDVLEKRRDPALVHRRHLEQTRELLAAGPVDLVIWPETVYSRGLQGPLPLSGEMIRQDLRVPLLFGAASVRSVGGRRRKFNSAFLIAADGTIRDGYDKNRLVPFAESLPFPALARFFPHAQDFGAGQGAAPLRLGPWRISTPICHETVWPDAVRRMVAAGDPHLIVSLANDAWFGDSAEPRIHLALARLRAVEHHRYLVRATNGGISAIVDPLGRVVARTGLLTRENLRGGVHLLAGATFYGRFGDWPGVAAALALGLALARPTRGRPARRAQIP
jgi:apolipoprotein N-acyltransferase